MNKKKADEEVISSVFSFVSNSVTQYATIEYQAFMHGGTQMIEVITVVNMLVEVKSTKDYEKKVEKILRAKTRMIQHIETISMSEPNEKLIVSALAKYRVLIEERMENKFLDDYVGLVLPMFYNRFKAMPVSNQIYKISRIKKEYGVRR